MKTRVIHNERHKLMQNAVLAAEIGGTEKETEREFKKRAKTLKKIAKALGFELWTDEDFILD